VIDPLVSVVMPCFNGERWIWEALESCLHQTYPAVEVVVVDDGSTDRTSEMVARFQREHGGHLPVTLVRQSNQGPVAARNRGLRQASGVYLQWLDADDLLQPHKISNQVQFLQDHTNVDAVYGDWVLRYVASNGPPHTDRRVTPYFKDFLIDHISGKWAPPHAFLSRRCDRLSWTWEQEDDRSIHGVEDHLYWINWALRGASFHYAPSRDCAVYRRGLGGDSPWRSQRNLLQASVNMHQSLHLQLAAAGLLEDSTIRRALARSYLELAWTAYTMGRPSSGKPAVRAAATLTSLRDLPACDLPFPVHQRLGVQRSLLLNAAIVRTKQNVKTCIYQRARLDPALPWKENLKAWATTSTSSWVKLGGC
jgi:Glycosyl transferase family 2